MNSIVRRFKNGYDILSDDKRNRGTGGPLDLSQSFKNGQALANQELENKYGNSPLFNGGPGSGRKGHTTVKDDKSVSSGAQPKKEGEIYKGLPSSEDNNFKGGKINFRTEQRPKAGEHNVVTVDDTDPKSFRSRRWVSKSGRKLTPDQWGQINDYSLRLGIKGSKLSAHISKS